MGSRKLIPCLDLLVSMAFAFPIKPSLSQSMSWIFIVSPNSLLDPTGGGVSDWLFGSWLLAGLIQDRLFFFCLIAKLDVASFWFQMLKFLQLPSTFSCCPSTVNCAELFILFLYVKVIFFTPVHFYSTFEQIYVLCKAFSAT